MSGVVLRQAWSKGCRLRAPSLSFTIDFEHGPLGGCVDDLDLLSVGLHARFLALAGAVLKCVLGFDRDFFKYHFCHIRCVA